jgi:sugar phosphate isomerase/epimerase
MRIYLSSWCLRGEILRGNLSLGDLPGFAVGHGFSGIEIMDRQIEASDPGYVEDLRKRCRALGCGLILDISSDLTHLEDKDWMDQIAYVKNALDVARRIRAEKARICLGGQSISLERIFKSFGFVSPNKPYKKDNCKSAVRPIQKLLASGFFTRLAKSYRKSKRYGVRDEDLKIKRALQAIRTILPKAEEYKIPLAIENHWGISGLPENILRIVDEIDSPYLGTCPDFENFPRGVDPYKGLQMLARRAILVHAKSLGFNAKGEETTIDYRRCLRILKESGYSGTITVEYEGGGDVVKGCLLTRELILRYW